MQAGFPFEGKGHQMAIGYINAYLRGAYGVGGELVV